MNYITIISRSEFTDLYKYGHAFVQNSVPFEGNLFDHRNDQVLFNALTEYMNTFEYSSEYLLLHFRVGVYNGSAKEIFIKDVVGVYAIDPEAKTQLSVSFDPRIRLQISPWTEKFNGLRQKQAIRQAKAGMYNCYEVFDIQSEERGKMDFMMRGNFLKDLFGDLYARKRPCGDQSIWIYLMRYERHSPYWRDDRGFFLDAIHVYENYTKKTEQDDFCADDTALGEVINNCNKDFNGIYDVINANAVSEYEVEGCNYMAVAPLFLYLKSVFSGGLDAAKIKMIEDEFKSKYKTDFAIAIGLLGLSLGQDLTYSCYYEEKKLPIFGQAPESDSNANLRIVGEQALNKDVDHSDNTLVLHQVQPAENECKDRNSETKTVESKMNVEPNVSAPEDNSVFSDQAMSAENSPLYESLENEYPILMEKQEERRQH